MTSHQAVLQFQLNRSPRIELLLSIRHHISINGEVVFQGDDVIFFTSTTFNARVTTKSTTDTPLHKTR